MPRSFLHRAASRVRRALTPPPTPAPPLPVVGIVVAGADGAHPASTHVRVVRRVEHLRAAGTIAVRQVDPAALADGTDDIDYAAVVVQRDVVPIAVVPAFLAAARSRGIPVVAEVDDDFFTDAGRERLARAEYDPDRLASVRAVVAGADTTIVSTAELAEVVRDLARQVVVVPNALDPDLWHRPPTAAETAGLPTVPTPDDEHRVLYMGTLTHAGDLELLAPVFRDLVAEDGLPIRLEVVGVTDAAGASWFRRLEAPDGHYPAFVRWLVASADRWSAGVAPLRDEAFNRAKSDLKFLEYTALGLPVVTSDRPSYAAVAPNGGVSVADDPGAWRTAVREAVALGHRTDRAAAYVLGERTLGADGPAWTDAVLGRLAG